MVSHRVKGSTRCAGRRVRALPCVNQLPSRPARVSAYWWSRLLTLPAITGRSAHAPSRGLAEQLNDRFTASSLGPSLTWPGHQQTLRASPRCSHSACGRASTMDPEHNSEYQTQAQNAGMRKPAHGESQGASRLVAALDKSQPLLRMVAVLQFKHFIPELLIHRREGQRGCRTSQRCSEKPNHSAHGIHCSKF